MDFSLMFWGDSAGGESANGTYDHVIRISKYADEHGYAAVWLPERHFHPWGGSASQSGDPGNETAA